MHNLESTQYNHSVVLCPSKLHPNHPKYIPLCDLYDIPHSLNCNVIIQIVHTHSLSCVLFVARGEHKC